MVDLTIVFIFLLVHLVVLAFGITTIACIIHFLKVGQYRPQWKYWVPNWLTYSGIISSSYLIYIYIKLW